MSSAAVSGSLVFLERRLELQQVTVYPLPPNASTNAPAVLAGARTLDLWGGAAWRALGPGC